VVCGEGTEEQREGRRGAEEGKKDRRGAEEEQ